MTDKEVLTVDLAHLEKLHENANIDRREFADALVNCFPMMRDEIESLRAALAASEATNEQLRQELWAAWTALYPEAKYSTWAPEELPAGIAKLRAALLEMREERDAERLRYGQQAARNAAFMLGLARLARMESSIQGIGELVRGIVAEADRAAAGVRLEDFTTAAVAKGGG